MPPAGYRSTTETEIKKSRFITVLGRTDSEAEARAFIAGVRADYPDARHHCTAFVVDEGVRVARSSDDGEPAGTAGMPMLNALTSADLTNLSAVVVRYFGGVKLGAGGLTRAYGGCVASAVAQMPTVVREVRPVWAARVEYAEAGRVQEELLRAGAVILGLSYDSTDVSLRFTLSDDPVATVARITQGTVVPVLDGEDSIEVPKETN